VQDFAGEQMKGDERWTFPVISWKNEINRRMTCVTRCRGAGVAEFLLDNEKPRESTLTFR